MPPLEKNMHVFAFVNVHVNSVSETGQSKAATPEYNSCFSQEKKKSCLSVCVLGSCSSNMFMYMYMNNQVHRALFRKEGEGKEGKYNNLNGLEKYNLYSLYGLEK